MPRRIYHNARPRKFEAPKPIAGHYSSLAEAIRNYNETGSFGLPESSLGSYDYVEGQSSDYDAPVIDSSVSKVDAFLQSSQTRQETGNDALPDFVETNRAAASAEAAAPTPGAASDSGSTSSSN